MLDLDILDIYKNRVGTLKLGGLFEEYKADVFSINEVVRYVLAQRHRGTHKVKNRSDISGSTKKLHRQKGTGSARVGSKKSPIRRHGGVAFGPKPRSYSIKLNKKIRKKVLASLISDGFEEDRIFVVNKLEVETYKTQQITKLLSIWNFKKVLLVTDDIQSNLELACRNISSVKLSHLHSLNVYDMLVFSNVIFSKNAIQQLYSKLG